ncbi:hypothetical protein BTVI_82328 [Pitangus sulphuratus]|nr:hypothetical protein BTVI_82328 [Pitangus sulphuratus]
MDLVKDLESKSYEKQLRYLRFCLGKRRHRRGLIGLYKYLKGGCNQVGIGLFSHATSDRVNTHDLTPESEWLNHYGEI